MRNILRERAKALATARPDSGRADDLLEVLRFDLASEKYAVELAWVGEVRPFVRFTVLPCVPRFVQGVINVRGRIICLVDLKVILDLPAVEPVAAAAVLVLRSGGRELGLLVDALHGTELIPAASLETSLPTLAQVRARYLRGVTPDGVAVLDGDRILSDRDLVVDGKKGLA